MFGLVNRRLRELRAMRAARAYAIGIALSSLLFASITTRSALTLSFWLREALISASWAAAGLATFAASKPLAEEDEAEGIVALTAVRGVAPRELELARALVAALRIATVVAGPALVVVLVGCWALARNAGSAWFAPRALAVIAYALGLGAVLAIAARVSARLAGKIGWLLLAFVIVGPELLRASSGAELVTLPSLCSWVIARIGELGVDRG